MTTDKPGTVNQQPLYGCTSCYEECTWPASDLHVHDGECWCSLCWDERRWEFPGQPNWNDLEPYTPAEQQPAPDSDALLEAMAELCDEIDKHEIHATISETSILWFKRKARNALAAHRKGAKP